MGWKVQGLEVKLRRISLVGDPDEAEKTKCIFAEVNKKGEGKGRSFAEAGPSG